MQTRWLPPALARHALTAYNATMRLAHAIQSLREWLHTLWRFYIQPTLFQQTRRHVVVQGVVISEGRVLLVKRTSPRAWELPGGGMDPGETPDAAVVREVREETGIQVKIVRPLGTYQRLGFRPHDGIVFVCRPMAGQPRVGEETVAVRYFPTDRLPLGLLPWYRRVIRDALAAEPSEPPPVRRQWIGPLALLASVLIVVAEHLRLIE
ncbi:MAG: hypothetical protein Kow0047_17240 [Anaerolineae bacterium]